MIFICEAVTNSDE